MIKHICVITPGYPSESKPYEFTFVDQLVCAIADKGIKADVIAPYDAIKNKTLKEKVWVKHTSKGNDITVYNPAAVTLTTRKIGILNMSYVSEWLYRRAVLHIMNKYRIEPDLLYAHFLFKAGTTAAAIGKKSRIPSVCAFGESSLWSIREIGVKAARKKLEPINGVIAVSTNNKNVLIENNLANKTKITVIPNAVNKKVFCTGDKHTARTKLGLPHNRIIGIYNGSFNPEKGAIRVAVAAEGIDNLSMIYLGGGKDEPQGTNILFKGRVAHEEVATWLKAADFFVLPTLAEGCCNAIIEAMSTGLPIITSDKPFNYDILDHESALLIDPMNIEALHNAIIEMTESEDLRKRYSEASIRKSQMLDIEMRADRILDYLNEIKEHFNSIS